VTRSSLLWIVAGLIFQAVLLAGAALLSRPASVLPSCAGIQAWFGSNRDSAVGQGRASARPLPEGGLPKEECDLEITPAYRGLLEPRQVEDFVRALEPRLGLLRRRIEQARRNPDVGWEAATDNVLIDQGETFAHIYYYYGRVCDGLRRLHLHPDADALSELRDRILQDYAAARRALELAEYATSAPVRSDEVARTVPRTDTARDHDTLREAGSAIDLTPRLATATP
jgi:hypothetical protein